MRLLSRKTLLIVFVTLLLAGISLLLITGSPRASNLPVHNGKSVEEWFHWPRSDAVKEFQAMSPWCIPYLIERAKGKETPLNVIHRTIFSVLPEGIKGKFPRARLSTANARRRAWFLLNQLQPEQPEWLDLEQSGWLGTYAKEIISAYQLSADRLHNSNAYMASKKAALSTEDLKVKTTFFQNHIHSEDPIVQLYSAIQLSEFDIPNTNVVHILTSALNDANLVANMAFNQTSLPVRKDVVWTETYPVKMAQKRIHEALTRIAPELANQYPIEEPEP